MKKLILFAFIGWSYSCSNVDQKMKRLDMKTMQKVVWQLMQADEYYTRVSIVDSTWKIRKKNIEFYQQIFDLNKVNRVDFYNTIDYLQRHPVEFKELMDSVNELSKREKK